MRFLKPHLGSIIPKVPQIQYIVIAGTEGYDFFDIQKHFGDDINDGLVSLQSAQNIGGDSMSGGTFMSVLSSSR